MAFTYFFRDVQTLDMVSRHVIPEIIGRRYIDIWDAGCASGQEAYTLAMMIREQMGKFLFRNVRIFATDIDGSNLFGRIIQEGIYPAEQVRRIPYRYSEQYFQPMEQDDARVRIDEEIRKSVHYQRHDLLTLQPPRSNLSLILCKNVLLHFRQEERIDVIRMFHQCLAPGGFFVTEQTQAMPQDVQDLFTPLFANARIFRKVDRSPCQVPAVFQPGAPMGSGGFVDPLPQGAFRKFQEDFTET